MSEDIKQKILKVLKHPQLAVLATDSGQGNPWCRYVFIMTDDDMTIRCASFKNARKVKQIGHNSAVHLTCGVNSLGDEKPYLQIQANATVVSDQTEKNAFWNPGLEKIFKGKNDPDYTVIVLKPYRIEYCIPENHEPEVWEKGL